MKHNKTKQQVQIEQQVLHNLSNIIEMFPQYTLAQHFTHFMRKKRELQDPYMWSDELLLNKVQDYYDELKDDLTTTNTIGE